MSLLIHHRPPFTHGRLQLLAGGVITVLLLAPLAGGPARAERPAPASRLSAEQVASAGSAISLTARPEGSSTLLVATLPDPPLDAASSALDAARLLDAAPGDGIIVSADLVGAASGTLTVQRRDGSQLLITLAGVMDGELSPDASWTAVVDGLGRLLRVDVETGAVDQLAAGPFLGPLRFAADGTLLLLAVSSVEAPWQSRLVRLDPTGGGMVALSEDELVYGPIPLRDGLAYAAHDHALGATLVKRLAATAPQLLADLGPAAIEVDVAPDGRAIAHEIVGDGIYLVIPDEGQRRRLGPGSAPRFSPDGELLTARRGDSTVVLRRDGSVHDVVAETTVAWSTCSAECAS